MECSPFWEKLKLFTFSNLYFDVTIKYEAHHNLLLTDSLLDFIDNYLRC